MTTQTRNYRVQLLDRFTGRNIEDAGGVVQVCQAGSPDKQALFDKDGASLANPLALVRGFMEFFIDVDVESVDLYIRAPGGQFVVAEGVKPSGPNEILVDTAKKEQVYKVPFSIADAVTDVEKDTGFDLPEKAFVLDRLHGCGLDVRVEQSGDTIDVGTFTGPSGADPDGLIDGSSLASPVLVIGTNGALFSTNAPHATTATVAKRISYTLIGTVTLAKGFILLPLRLV